MRWAGHVARMWESRGVYKVLVGKPEGRRPHGRPRHIWEDNIKLDLQEVSWTYGLDLSGLGLGQVAGTFKCGNAPSGSTEYGESHD